VVTPRSDADPRATLVATPYRLARATALVLGLFLVGAIGYTLIEGVPWWDAFYMTVITITTVGFGHVFPLSPAGQVLTVALLGAGIGVFLFLASEVGRSIMEGELQRYLGHVRRVRMIERMSGHDVVCGYGRMGRAAVDALRRAGRSVVVVEARSELTGDLAEGGCPVVTGDATQEAALRAANVERASGLVCCLADDANNLYTVLTARSLNPALVIVARAAGDGAEQRMRQAGADEVVNPYRLGGARLADLLVEPAGARDGPQAEPQATIGGPEVRAAASSTPTPPGPLPGAPR
jgi:voltage-gated potassium channel